MTPPRIRHWFSFCRKTRRDRWHLPFPCSASDGREPHGMFSLVAVGAAQPQVIFAVVRHQLRGPLRGVNRLVPLLQLVVSAGQQMKSFSVIGGGLRTFFQIM